jgi:hypothetical protein
LIASSVDQRANIPAGWEKTVSYFNHSELLYVNGLASKVGLVAPFPNAEVLPKDNGERFFSEYLTTWLRGPTTKRVGLLGDCLCPKCTSNGCEQVASSVTKNITIANTPTTITENNRQLALPATITDHSTAMHASVANPTAVLVQQPMARQSTTMNPLAPRHIILQQHFPLYFVNPMPPPPCCGKYHHWLFNTRRKGRPPHDSCCPSKFG